MRHKRITADWLCCSLAAALVSIGVLASSAAISATDYESSGLAPPAAASRDNLPQDLNGAGHLAAVAPFGDRHKDATEYSPNIFGSVALRVRNTSHSKRWRELVAEDAQKYLADGCTTDAVCTNTTFRKLKQVRDKAGFLGERAAVEMINRSVNATIKYQTDQDLYGSADYWAEFRETVARATGDCEDIALVKMWMLNSIGIPLTRMHLVLVTSNRLRTNHAILVVQSEGAFIVLDNLTDRISVDNGVDDYKPLLTFGALGEWTHGFRAAAHGRNDSGVTKLQTYARDHRLTANVVDDGGRARKNVAR